MQTYFTGLGQARKISFLICMLSFFLNPLIGARFSYLPTLNIKNKLKDKEKQNCPFSKIKNFGKKLKKN